MEVYDEETQLSIFLNHYNSAGKCVLISDPVLVKMSILNGRGHKFCQQVIPSSPNCCFLLFAFSKAEIIESKCRQTDESLNFCVKIFFHEKIDPVSPAVPSSAVDCSGRLITQLEGLFDGKQFSDVNFKVGDRLFPGHQLILSTRSQVFAAMFKHQTKEKLSNQIVIEDMDPEVFHQLLRFIYTGKLSSATIESMAASLFIAADKYLLDGLKNECEKYLVRNICPDNCVLLLLYGDLLHPAEYLMKAAKFFLRFPIEVMATDGWKKMKKENPTLLCDIQEFVYCHKYLSFM